MNAESKELKKLYELKSKKIPITFKEAYIDLQTGKKDTPKVLNKLYKEFTLLKQDFIEIINTYCSEHHHDISYFRNSMVEIEEIYKNFLEEYSNNTLAKNIATYLRKINEFGKKSLTEK